MFHVGDRVTVGIDNYSTGTIVSDEGGGDYCVELDKVDPETGRKKRIGVQGRFLQSVDALRPPVEGMVTKGGEPRTPLTAALDLSEDEPGGGAEFEGDPPASDESGESTT